MRKRGQAAMEFLMTYGWAILVVLIVIGALAYFGVLNPQQFLPQKCQFSTGLVCVDKQLTNDGVFKLRISNGLGNAIDITGISITDTQGFASCDSSADSAWTNTILLSGEEKNIVCNMPATPAPDLKSGQRIKANMVLSYDDKQTGYQHDVPGPLLIDIE